MTKGRDHGGNLDAAIAQYGGMAGDWIDLSTGINPTPYPVPEISAQAWAVLPQKSHMAALCDAARDAYETRAEVVPFAGAQGVIQAMPWLMPTATAKVIAPTYNEHAAALRAAGWAVNEVADLAGLQGADLAVVVNPNNPDGTSYSRASLLALARQVGLLVVDESFADPAPQMSIAPVLDQVAENIIVLRSFGKFYGLAGLRLGFALTSPTWAHKLRDMAGPWPVSGPAIAIAGQALRDTAWHNATRQDLSEGAARLDALAYAKGWSLVGGTPLFRTYATPDAPAAQEALAHHHVWSRIFPYSPTWIRLGLPAKDRWDQLARAMAT